MYIALVVVSLLTVAACRNINPVIPILPREPGVLYNGGGTLDTATVRLEAVMEVTCPESGYAWEILKQLCAHYGQSLAVIIHQYPLPFHHNAQLVTQGFYLVNENMTQDAAWAYMEETMLLWSNFSNTNTAHMTPPEILDYLADIAVDVTGVDKDFFIENIYSYAGYTIDALKYAARRGAAGTPWFFVNGVDIGVSPSIYITFDNWTALLDPLFEDPTSINQLKANFAALQ